MNHFRKHTPEPRRAVDGILNAPTRSGLNGQPLGRRMLSAESFRTSTRRVDGFKRTEGFHASNRPAAVQQRQSTSSSLRSEQAPRQSSLLHMTLPGGELATRKDRTKDKKKGGKRSLRKWTVRSAVALSLLLILVGGFLFTKGFFQFNKVFKGGGSAAALQTDVKPELLKGEGDGRINILMLGRGGTGHDGPDLTDTLLLASIDPVNKTTVLVSVPRDTWVAPSGSTSSTKVNSVYANAKSRALNVNSKDKEKAEAAGIKAVQQTISDVLGVPIHYYAMVDFEAFQQAINTVGGITVNVPEDLRDTSMAWQNGGSAVLAKQGQQTFDGRRALMYVRSRHGSARGDFDRAERQRLVIVALSQKILSAGTFTNPVKISSLLDAFGDHVSTDLSINDALRLMSIAKGIHGNGITSVGLADPPTILVTTDNINGQSVVRPVAGIGDFSKIQEFVRLKLRDGYIAKENGIVHVLNGTETAGLAGTKAEQLKTYGYNVTKVADAPTQDFQKTVVVDLTKGKKPYTKNYLEKRFGVKAVTKLPGTAIQPENADFVIILGSNETTNSQN